MAASAAAPGRHLQARRLSHTRGTYSQRISGLLFGASPTGGRSWRGVFRGPQIAATPAPAYDMLQASQRSLFAVALALRA
jgi:hypothetical protein